MILNFIVSVLTFAVIFAVITRSIQGFGTFMYNRNTKSRLKEEEFNVQKTT